MDEHRELNIERPLVKDKPFDSAQDKPAAFGGEPVFKKMLPIIRPTLISPERLSEEIKEIFRSGNVTTARWVKKLEQACSKYVGTKHAVAVSSATSGLMLAVKGLDLEGEVIVPSFTFAATVHSLAWNNLTPVFADCEEETGNIDATKIEEKITSKTSAIMPVYIFGNPPRIKELEAIAGRNSLRLVFDSAQALGAEYRGIKAGGFGDCEVFSLSPTKVLTSLEGGLITTNNARLAEFLRQARDYGKSIDGSDIDYVGLSARMSEVHALIGLKNLENLETYLAARRDMIALYKSLLNDIEGIRFQTVLHGNKSSGNYMVIFIDEARFGMTRDDLYEALKTENIQTKKYFFPAVHMQKAFVSFRSIYKGTLPVTEKAAMQGLALPLYGHIGSQTVGSVCRAVRRIHCYCRHI